MLVTEAISADLSVAKISTAAGVDEIALDWDRLAGDVPFRRREWLETWWRHYLQPGMELFIVALRDADGELVGLAPWHLKRSALSGRVLCFLGSGEVCSDYLTVLAAPGQEQLVARRLADWLGDEARELWDLIELDGIELGDPLVHAMSEELAAQGCVVHRRERLGAWRLELPADWKSYLARLSKSRRGGVRTLEKRHFETGRAMLRTAQSGVEVARGLAILHELHQRRRASLGDAGCFASPRFARFLAEAAERFHELGQLRLQWLELDGRPVAAEFDLNSADTIYHYQSGIDPDAMQDKPGWLVQIGALRTAIEEGFRWFDFLRGDEPYKSWWRAERRSLFEVRIVARRRSARLRHRVWIAGVHTKTWLREIAAWARRRWAKNRGRNDAAAD
jgi:CelD/BcsL family acetyltransferase involved in cellulose biosynthesis